MKVFEAELRAAQAEARATELRSVLDVVFKSPKYKSEVYGNMPLQSGQFGTTTQSFSEHKTISED